MEEWRDVGGALGSYMASSNGRIKSLDRLVTYRCPKSKTGFKIMLRKGKILSSLAVSSNGYIMVKVLRKRTLHRLIAETFVLNPENKPCVNHKNGIKTDNRAVNLEWCTYSENIRHAFSSGLNRIPKGEDNHASRLSNKDRDDILRRGASGEHLDDLKNRYPHVSKAHISLIVRLSGSKMNLNKSKRIVSNEDVVRMRSLYGSGKSFTEIKKLYANLSEGTISDIIKNRTYKDLLNL